MILTKGDLFNWSPRFQYCKLKRLIVDQKILTCDIPSNNSPDFLQIILLFGTEIGVGASWKIVLIVANDLYVCIFQRTLEEQDEVEGGEVAEAAHREQKQPFRKVNS